MAKYHINPSTGNVSICRSVQGRCPFGEAAHADTPDAARNLYEQTMSQSSGSASLKKSSVPTPQEDWDNKFEAITIEAEDRRKAAVRAGATSELMTKYYGAGSYEKTIQSAKDRAGYATAYYDKKAEKSEATSRVLEGNSTLASAGVATRTSSALAAARSARQGGDFSRMSAYATPAVDNIDAVKAALRSKGAAKVTSPIGAAAGRFSI